MVACMCLCRDTRIRALSLVLATKRLSHSAARNFGGLAFQPFRPHPRILPQPLLALLLLEGFVAVDRLRVELVPLTLSLAHARSVHHDPTSCANQIARSAYMEITSRRPFEDQNISLSVPLVFPFLADVVVIDGLYNISFSLSHPPTPVSPSQRSW